MSDTQAASFPDREPDREKPSQVATNPPDSPDVDVHPRSFTARLRNELLRQRAELRQVPPDIERVRQTEDADIWQTRFRDGETR
jgi:hypothetical protein